MNHKTFNYVLVVAAIFGCVNAYNIGYGNGQKQYAVSEKKLLQECVEQKVKAVASFGGDTKSALFGVQLCLYESTKRLNRDAK